ncbi:GAF domain-containing protein [Neobacillus notoginsengisoli]|nr:GAF domain-containing protein [Neobacillus notoginsengisoli]
MENNHFEEEETIKEKPLSKPMVLACYLVALLLVVSIVYGFTGIIADILTKALNKPVSRMDITNSIAVVFLMYRLMRIVGDHWRSNPKNEIGTAVTNLPNPFYDPSFRKGPLLIQKEYSALVTKYKLTQLAMKKINETLIAGMDAASRQKAQIKVMLRHNENANRLLRSYNFLHFIKDADTTQKMLKNILEECITVLEKDQSDKSISLFRVNENEQLEIIESVRINAESIAKRVFSKGEGFAGSVWGKGKPDFENNVVSSDPRFHDLGLQATPIGSILGFPLNVDDQILGVLCIQSEEKDGFVIPSDLRTVEFYARLCTLILLCDKIKNKSKRGGI